MPSGVSQGSGAASDCGSAGAVKATWVKSGMRLMDASSADREQVLSQFTYGVFSRISPFAPPVVFDHRPVNRPPGRREAAAREGRLRMTESMAPRADRLTVRDIELEVVRRGTGRTIAF